VTSHLVAPSAYAASRCRFGTELRISRDTDVMIGMIMIERMIPPESMPIPKIGPLKNGVQPNAACSPG